MSGSIEQWGEVQFARADFGDTRLDRRFPTLLVDIGRYCGKNPASAFSAWSGINGAYRFFANSKVDKSRMLTRHIEHTVARSCEHDTILALQDTVYLDYSQRDKTPDLDFVQRSKLGKIVRGLMLHNTLACTVDGSPTGLLDRRFIERQSFHGRDAQEKKQIGHCNQAVGRGAGTSRSFTRF